MSHEVETMAFANEVPWHGLGNRVDPSVSVEEMLVAAGLDWTVSLRPVFAQAKDGTMIKMPIKRALMRDSDHKVFCITGDFWKPVQNREALEFFRDWTEQGGAKLETAGSLRGGKMIWALASIDAGFTVGRKDHSKGYILLTSPHEVGKATTVRTTMVRVVCANTLAMAENADGPTYKQSHTTRFDMQAAKEAVGLARDEVAKMALDAKALAGLKMSRYDSVRFLASFFQDAPEGVSEKAFVDGLINEPSKQDKKLSAVLHSFDNAPGADPTSAWGILNAITHWADHVAGKTPESRLYNAWMGKTADLKLDVKDKLLQLV